MRSFVRPLIAVLLAVPALVLIAPTVQAATGESQHPSSGTYPAVSRTLTISITGVSPRYVNSNSTVTLSGTLSNTTGSAISGLSVQAETSIQWFGTRSAMNSFIDGADTPYVQQAGLPFALSGTLGNGRTVRWSVSYPAGDFYSDDQIAVYPVVVVASTPDANYQATSRTLLPYWPGSTGGTPLQVSWIWPLIDTPQQGACGQTLATNSLATSLAAGGRLNTLLSAGAQYAQTDRITWAIDPALLSDASVLTGSYFTGGNGACSGRFVQPPSTAAKSWLSALQTDTAGEPAFATSYADVDVAALSHAGLNGIIASAYQLGDATAEQLLPDTFGTASGGGSVLAAAWPAGGTADAGVVESLAKDAGIATVVLNSSALASSDGQFDNALARTPNGTGTATSVLLADSEITSLLGSATASQSATGQFAVTQDFLAQTAMILAEAPGEQRSLVVAPPSDWDPSPAEAASLLALTKAAPWLRPTTLSTLSAEAAKVPEERLPARQVTGSELSQQYMDKLQALDDSVGTFTDMLYQPSKKLVTSLNAAIAATASSAWRGSGSPGGWLALTQLTYYLSDSENKVRILDSGTDTKIQMAGTSGTIPVSVQNLFNYPVQVEVVASTVAGSPLTVGKSDLTRVVQPGKTSTVRLSLRSSAIGTSTLRLELYTTNGKPLTWTAQSLSVEVTRFGRTLLIIIGGALAVLVLASALRLRRRRRTGTTSGDVANDSGADNSVHAGGAG